MKCSRAGLTALVALVSCSRGAGEPASSPVSEPSGGVTREATPAEVEEIKARIEAAILATVELSAPILARGDIAEVAIEGDRVAVVGIDRARAERIAAVLERDYPQDVVSPRWFRRRGGPGRIFVTIHQGSFLFNFEPGRGYRLEPGSMDSDRGR